MESFARADGTCGVQSHCLSLHSGQGFAFGPLCTFGSSYLAFRFTSAVPKEQVGDARSARFSSGRCPASVQTVRAPTLLATSKAAGMHHLMFPRCCCTSHFSQYIFLGVCVSDVPAGGSRSVAILRSAPSLQRGGLSHLEELLAGQVDIDYDVLDTIAASAPLSARLMAVATVPQALSLYLSAASVPRSATRLALSQDGLLLDGPMPMPAGHVSKSEFMFAFQSLTSGKLAPRVLKIFASRSGAELEGRLWRELGAEASSARIALVPVSECSIPRSSTRRAFAPSGGLLMPHFSCTLAEVPSPVPTAFALATLVEMTRVLVFLHDHGWWHADVKPSNLFMDTEGGLFLGDYGTCVRYSGVRPAAAQFEGGYAGSLAFQCASVQPGMALFTPLRFDRIGLAITMLLKLSMLRLQDAPAYPGWQLARLREVACTISDKELRAAVLSLLST